MSRCSDTRQKPRVRTENSSHASAFYRFLVEQEHVGGGDLFDAITPEVGCGVKRAAVYIKQLCSAVAYMHERDIVHRDLKVCVCSGNQQAIVQPWTMREYL